MMIFGKLNVRKDSINYPTEQDRQDYLNQIDNVGDMLAILREIESDTYDFTEETIKTVYGILYKKFNIMCM